MTLYKRRKTWWVEYQVDGVRHRQSTHTHKYAVAKAWASQIDTARKMPTFEEAVEVLKMFYKKPVEGLLPLDHPRTRAARPRGRQARRKAMVRDMHDHAPHWPAVRRRRPADMGEH